MMSSPAICLRKSQKISSQMLKIFSFFVRLEFQHNQNAAYYQGIDFALHTDVSSDSNNFYVEKFMSFKNVELEFRIHDQLLMNF